MILYLERVALESEHHTLQAAWCSSQRAFEDDFKGLVVTVNSHVRLAKEKLVELMKGMNDSESFLFNLSIALLSGSERAGTVSHRLPLDVSRVSEVGSGLE